MLNVACPDCGHEAQKIGSIPATDIFAGRLLERPIPGGNLFRCPNCYLGFRYPRLPKEELDALYAQGSDKTWSGSFEARRDWLLAYEWLNRVLTPGTSILDVGCFDGGFLSRFTSRYHCFGIEIHPEARKRAEDQGIKIIGSDFKDLENHVFETITAFDVIEHVASPKRFLERCLTSLPKEGRIVISTGNMDSWTFRLMGSRYWYCAIAEHISFVSPCWFKKYAPKIGFHIEHLIHFSHGDRRFFRRTKDMALNLAYLAFPFLLRWLRRKGFGGKDARKHPEPADHPPSWMSAQDHFLVVLVKC